MTYILSSVEPRLILNLRHYKTSFDMWDYLSKVYKHNTARRFQLEYRLLILHREVSPLKNICLVFKIFELTIQTLFMPIFSL